jgi:hypothetical protein
MRRVHVLALVALALAAAWLAWPRRAPPPLPVSSEELHAGDEEPAAEPPRAVHAVAPRPPVTAGPREAPEGSPGSFEGRVVSALGGDPIPHAELTFAHGSAAASVSAGRDGRFRFAPPAAGRWTLAAASAPGFLPFAPEWGHSPVLLDARPGARVRDVIVTLAPAVEYRAVVLSAAGTPVPGAEVRILGAAAGETALLPLPDRHVAGPGGELTLVAPEDAVLEATAPGHGRGRATVDFAARVSRRLAIRLGPAEAPGPRAAIRGVVELPSGAPSPETLVVALPRRFETEEPPRQALTDEAGAFELPDLPAGRWDVVARRPGLAPARARAVEPGGPPLALRLADGGRLAGRVVDRDTGRPVTPFTVVARRRDRLGGALQSLAVVDPDGRFELEGLPAGRVYVAAAAPGYAPAQAVPVEIAEPGAAPATVQLELARGGVAFGTVRSRATGAPIPGAEVEVEGAPEPAASAVPVRFRAIADGGGRFEVAGLPPRPVSLFVSAAGHHARVVPVEPAAGDDRRGPLELELTPLAGDERPQVEMAGIGAVLTPRGDALRVSRVAPGGGAAEAGLAPGDEILRVEGRAIADLDFETAVNLVRGAEGTTVVLEVRRAGGRVERVAVTRRLVRS